MNVSQIVTLSSGATAFTLNLLLLPVILLKSSERIGCYKYYLFAYTLNASLFALSLVSTLPTWYIPPNGYVFQSTITILPRPIQQVQVMLCVLSYTSNTIIIAWCFIYRLAVFENHRPWLARPRYVPLIIGGSFVLLCYLVASCLPTMPNDHFDELFHESIFNATGVALAEINGSVNIGLAICLGSYCILTFSAFSIIIYCWTKIGAKLRDLRRLSNASYSFHYKIYLLLSMQIIMPIIFNIFPAFIVFVLSLAKVSIGDAILLCGMVLSFAQIVDPILTVILIADYKKAIFRCGRKIMNMPQTSSNLGNIRK